MTGAATDTPRTIEPPAGVPVERARVVTLRSLLLVAIAVLAILVLLPAALAAG
jgi:hypothetical protein